MDFVKKSISTFAALVMGSILGVATSVVIARFLGPSGKGIYSIAIRTAGILIAFGQFGIPEVLLYYTGKENSRINNIGGVCLAIVALSGIFSIIIFYIAYLFLRNSVFQGVGFMLLFIAVCAAPFNVGFLLFMRIAQLKEKIAQYNLANLSKAFLTLILTFIMILMFTEKRLAAISGFFVAELLGAIVVIWYVKAFLRDVMWRLNLKEIKEAIKGGLKVQFGMVAAFLGTEIGVFIINNYLDLSSVGWYSTALGLGKLLLFVSIAIRTIMQAKLSCLIGDREVLAEKTTLVCRHTLIWLVIGALGIGLFGKGAIYILYGSAFFPSYKPLLFILPGMIAYGLSQIIASYFISIKKFIIPSIVAWVLLGVGILLQVLFIPMWGMEGSGLAFSLSYLLTAALFLFLFIKNSNKNLKDFLLKKEDILFYQNLLTAGKQETSA